jgi:signal transduction histidine kinase
MKAALLAGFGLIFGIWLFAGYSFMNRLDEIERRTADVNVRYMKAQELLTTVRGQILLGSVYVRDALLAPSAEVGESRRQVEDAYQDVEDALKAYVPVLDSAIERERVQRLREQIEDFKRTTLHVLEVDSSRWPADARALLNSEVVPKRNTVIRVSEAVQALNRTAFVQQQQEIAAIYTANQRRLWQMLGVGLAIGFGIAMLVAAHAGRLERRLRHQSAVDAGHARELSDLSAKLISVQEDERRTLARELHDEVGQALTAIKVELAVAERSMPASANGAGLLDDARSIAETALATVRDMSHLLHPALLDDLGLAAAAEWYVAGFSRRHQIRVDLVCTGLVDRLAPEVEVSLYRILQEAMTNVTRHAAATWCRVTLARDGTTARAVIEDNGRGFTPGARSDGRPGLGLLSIRERAAQLGGRAEIISAPGAGTRIIVEVPGLLRSAADDRRTVEVRPQPAPESVGLDG